jgi:hypothetical protein
MLTMIDKEHLMAAPASDRPLTRTDRAVLLTFAGIAALVGLVTLAGGVLRIRLYVLSAGDGTPLALMTETPLDAVRSGTTPEIVFGVYPTADLLVRGLSDVTRILLGLGEGLAVVVAAVVSIGMAALFWSTARGRPFARPLYGWALVAGATLSIGSLLAQGISGFGRMNAAVELNDVTGDIFQVGFPFDPAPVVIGFAIMAMAYIFRAGARLQRDTEGLV